MYKILIIDDELPVIRGIVRNLDNKVYQIEEALDGETGLKMIEQGMYDVLVCDLMMPNIDGFKILECAKKIDPNVVFIMITAFSSVGAGIRAMSMGAYDFFQKPFDHDHLNIVIENGLKTRELKTENINLKAQLASSNKPAKMIGKSSAIKNIMKDIQKLADSTVNILIEGESGTGKELLARHIHYNSPRRYGPFIPLNCASIPSELLESELFGHEKGAFTGASQKKYGLIETSYNGTFFLDELNNLKMELQAKILRVLQEKSFRRVGGTKEISTNVRIISASSKNLKQMIDDKLFREALYYRLKVVNFVVPPLRERITDVPLLAKHFLEDISRNANKQCEISEEVIEAFKRYSWPGNIRELRNIIERIVALYDPLDANYIKLILSELNGKEPEILGEHRSELSLAAIEYKHIMRVLEMTNWNKSDSSKILKIDYTTLYRKLKKYGIKTQN